MSEPDTYVLYALTNGPIAANVPQVFMCAPGSGIRLVKSASGVDLSVWRCRVVGEGDDTRAIPLQELYSIDASDGLARFAHFAGIFTIAGFPTPAMAYDLADLRTGQFFTGMDYEVSDEEETKSRLVDQCRRMLVARHKHAMSLGSTETPPLEQLLDGHEVFAGHLWELFKPDPDPVLSAKVGLETLYKCWVAMQEYSGGHFDTADDAMDAFEAAFDGVIFAFVAQSFASYKDAK